MPTIDEIRRLVKKGKASVNKSGKIVRKPTLSQAPRIPKGTFHKS